MGFTRIIGERTAKLSGRPTCHDAPSRGISLSGPWFVDVSMHDQDDPVLHPDPPDGPQPRGDAEHLVRAFNQSLVRMLQVRLHSYDDARDVAQEAYAKLLSLGPDAAIGFHRAYLFRIAQNLATDLLRRRAYTERSAPDVLEFHADPAANPERAAGAAQAVARLPALLAELPFNCAEAFRLVRVEQLSFAEAGARLQLTERMIRIHVARALAHCQLRLEGITEGREGSDD